jgi:hypothetical protein
VKIFRNAARSRDYRSAILIMALALEANRGILPLVSESSAIQPEAGDRVRLLIWSSMNAAVLSGRFLSATYLSSRLLKLSQEFGRTVLILARNKKTETTKAISFTRVSFFLITLGLVINFPDADVQLVL